MLKSLKKTWNEAKKEPVFTLLYIFGVAFAIAFVMIYAIFYYVRAAPIYPEYSRSKTLVLERVQLRGDGSMTAGWCSGWFGQNYLAHLDGVEMIVAAGPRNYYAQSTATSDEVSIRALNVSPNFFTLFPYKFLQGRPFDETLTSSDQKVAIITDELARYAFGTVDNAVGKEITIGSEPKTVVGVVRQASPIAHDAYAQAFLPNTMEASKYADSELMKALGYDKLYIVKKDGYGTDDVQKQLDDVASRMLRADTIGNPGHKYDTFVVGPLTDVLQNALGPLVEQKTWSNIVKQHLWVLIVLLIIPAINISGMIGAQMERKYSEIGIRRSFGATKGAITRQVLLENLYLTIAGGLIGLVCAWIFICLAHGWLFDLLEEGYFSLAGVPKNVSAEMLFAPAVFVITLVICIVLNLVSAYIPVRWTLRRQVVNYINDNK